MKIRFLKHYGESVPGDIIEPDMPDIAHSLIIRGIAESYLDPVEDEKSFDHPPADKMMRREKVRTK